ncbi:MAG: hypothetical protein AAF589_05600, partial [Planctomycetota bacterium]
MGDAAVEELTTVGAAESSGTTSREAAAFDGPACSNCELPLASAQTTACPHCGWYASAGVFVEIEAAWEAAVAGETTEQPESALAAAARSIPKWAIIVFACAASALAGSIAVRFGISDEVFRSTWSVTQLFVGLGLALACHITVFVVMAMDDPDMGLGDIVVNPFSGWRKLVGQMPRRVYLLGAVGFALAAVLGSVAIIGGIPYDRLWDWGVKPPPKKDLLSAIADAAPGGGEMSMEEAMDSFAADAAVNGAGGPKGLPKNNTGPVNLKRKKIDALILGYQVDRNNAISTLFLATEVNGRLMYAGRVTPSLTPDESLELVEKFQKAAS